MTTPTLTKNFIAEAAVTKRRIVKHGAADGKVLHGAAATDFVFGVVADLDAALGARADVVVAGIVKTEFGGAIARGEPVTSDANGKAVKAAPAAGVNNRIIGFAWVSGVDGDIAPVQLAPGQIQG